MADATKKCAHEMCSCSVADDQKYCSQNCEDNVGSTQISCDCKHPGCSGELTRAL